MVEDVLVRNSCASSSRWQCVLILVVVEDVLVQMRVDAEGKILEVLILVVVEDVLVHIYALVSQVKANVS